MSAPKELTSQHSDSLTQLLKPLTTELDAFKKRMNEVYENETRDRVSLRQEIVSLKALNQKMSGCDQPDSCAER